MSFLTNTGLRFLGCNSLPMYDLPDLSHETSIFHPTTQEMLKTWDEELSYGFAIAKDSDYHMVREFLPKLSK